jgi:hypothetical protein
VSEERAHGTVHEKKKSKKKFNDKKKLSVVFDRAMSNVYENNIFPTLPCYTVEIHDVKLSQHSDNGFCFKIRISEENFQKMFIKHVQFHRFLQDSP